MAITYTLNFVTAAASSIPSGLLTLTTGDVVTAVVVESGQGAAFTIANSGSALTWNAIGETHVAGNVHVRGWWASVPDDTDRTVTISGCQSARRQRLHCMVHTGAHATTPVPAGNRFSGSGANDVSQAFTLTASGSALWMVIGDWNATNSYAAIANCSLEGVYQDAAEMTACAVRPTTQPRPDGAAFTLGETDTGGIHAWLAFEVQAAAGGAPTPIPRPRPSVKQAVRRAAFM